MRERCIAPYTAKMAMGHVASSAPGASQMYMSVLIGSCGSSGPVITLKPLWGSPGTELSTWSTGSLCCIRAIQRTRIASRPLRSYTAIQRYTLYSYTSLYTIQAIQHPSGLSRRDSEFLGSGFAGREGLPWSSENGIQRRQPSQGTLGRSQTARGGFSPTPWLAPRTGGRMAPGASRGRPRAR